MAFKMRGNPMKRNFGIGSSPLTDKIPESGTGKDDETGTHYYRGMAQRDEQRDALYSSAEAEAAEQLGSRKVDRAHRRHKRKAHKMGDAKGLSKEARRRRNARRRKRALKAEERAQELTAKRFAKTEKGGQDAYNRVIEDHNKKARERKAKREAERNK
jgi:hypothetical protein